MLENIYGFIEFKLEILDRTLTAAVNQTSTEKLGP